MSKCPCSPGYTCTLHRQVGPPVSVRDDGTEPRNHVTFADAVEIAQGLTIPGEVNEEYVRGQAELICDLFGISTDQKDVVRALITEEDDTLTLIRDLLRGLI